MPGTTPIYGFPYPEPTDLVADYPALGQDLAEDVETVIAGASGLKLITNQSFTAASAVNVNNVFSSSYLMYRILIDQFGGTNTTNLRMRLRVSGTDATGANYDYTYLGYRSDIGTEQNQAVGQTAWLPLTVNGTDTTFLGYDIDRPFETTTTAIMGIGARLNATPTVGFLTFCGFHKVNTSYTGFSFYPDTGTFSGSVRVFGYKN